jgi:O-antigen ligase
MGVFFLHRPRQTLSSLCAVGFVSFFLSKTDIFLGMRQHLLVRPLTLFVLGTIPLLIHIMLSAERRRRCWDLLEKCQVEILAFLLVVFVSLVGVFRSLEGIEGDFRPVFFPMIAFFVFLVGMIFVCSSVHQPVWKTSVLVAFAITAVTICVDVFVPGTFSSNAAQAAGIAENPNGGALVILLLLVALLDWERRLMNATALALLIVALVSVYFTLSRAGMLTYVMVALFYFLRMRRLAMSIPPLLATMALSLLLAATFVWDGQSQSEPAILQIATAKRDDLWAIGSNSTDKSIVERIEVVERSLELMAEAPIAGLGSGYSYGMIPGPHNMYLARWIDNGVLGFLSYCLLILALLAVNYRRNNIEGLVLAFVMAFFGLFSHNVLEDRTLLLLLAVSTASRARSETTSKRPSRQELILGSHSRVRSQVT